MNEIKATWARSKTYRALLIAAIVYSLLRLAVQVYFSFGSFESQAVEEGGQISVDLQQSYVMAAKHFWAREDLYLKGSLEILELHYPYSPAFAFLYSPILLLPTNILLVLMFILHLGAYALLYFWWRRIFNYLQPESSLPEIWAWMLPVFLVFSVFWDDLAYMNIYLIVALYAAFLIDAVVRERLAPAAFWLGVMILPVKPHWAFAAALPLLLGRYRFFFKLMLWTILSYLAVTAITVIGGGIGYGLAQYRDYFGFLARLSRDFPWWGPDRPFLGYNHSVMQVVLYFLGVSPGTMRLATVIKLFILAPLGFLGLRLLVKPLKKPATEVPQMALDLVFALYLGAFVWLDMVWELSLGVVIFAYLLAVVKDKWPRLALWVLFAPYALLDIWRLLSYIAFGDEVLYNGAYVLTDPLIYVPVIMLIILLFYGLLLRKLWQSPQLQDARA
ncbi:MAG: hypothetical protein AB1846_06845 [Chloroflexota bacterium]